MGQGEYAVTYSPKSREDLSEIVHFIAQDDPHAAERFGQKLVDEAEEIGVHPLSGRFVPEFRNPRIRERIYRNYRIVYRVDKESERVVVVRFWHAARGRPDL
jgi:toxin ParE1/3/4